MGSISAGAITGILEELGIAVGLLSSTVISIIVGIVLAAFTLWNFAAWDNAIADLGDFRDALGEAIGFADSDDAISVTAHSTFLDQDRIWVQVLKRGDDANVPGYSWSMRTETANNLGAFLTKLFIENRDHTNGVWYQNANGRTWMIVGDWWYIWEEGQGYVPFNPIYQCNWGFWGC